MVIIIQLVIYGIVMEHDTQSILTLDIWFIAVRSSHPEPMDQKT